MNKLFLSIVIFLLGACSGLQVEITSQLEKRVPNIIENAMDVDTKTDLQEKDNEDTIQKLIENAEADTLGDEYRYFPIAQKIVRNQAPVYDAPNNGKMLRVLNKDSKVFIFDRKNNWERITIENDSPQWIDSKYLCSNETCHKVHEQRARSRVIVKNTDRNISSVRKLNELKTSNQKLNAVSKSSKNYSKNKSDNIYGNSCSCAVVDYCVGPRGGHYCITSGGNKRYLPR
ncbi:hypothetical protein E0H80_14970 [Acinetobacter sp. ANC 4779]|uniref:hypothetical protein n=1 Tax=Acinetobacter sp. ANC 4779 TaxID=2529848 RepID=UPI00103BAF76|nr:hypothetical protein [Acinetobacter sp. ANC 4779]TCB48504.1 hypothetical protein E0H80_14970 [Acinetobacter sp. ANC 4779]